MRNYLLLKTLTATAVVTSLTLSTNLALTESAQAGAVRAGFDTSILERNDDSSTGLVDLGFNINFFGADASQVYVNNNGNISFTGPLSAYTPFGLGARGERIIAAYFADVDTRGTDSGIVSYGTGTVDGRNAFGVNYPDVGYFSSNTDKLNNFQLLLIDRSDTGANNFDIEFNYDQVQWETGDFSGGTDGLGGTSAALGYSNGILGSGNISLDYPGSLLPGTFLDTGTDPLIAGMLNSDGILGRYVFGVRNGQTPGTTPTNPLLPSGNSGSGASGFTFPSVNIVNGGLGITTPIFIDPDLATGYDYSVTGGPLFASVLIPTALPNGDDSFNLTLPGSGTYNLLAGTTFDLLAVNSNGFSAFTIDGIDIAEALDPTDPTAFITGLTFTTGGSADISQIPIITSVGQAVPEPFTILGSITALGFGVKLKKKLAQKKNSSKKA